MFQHPMGHPQGEVIHVVSQVDKIVSRCKYLEYKKYLRVSYTDCKYKYNLRSVYKYNLI